MIGINLIRNESDKVLKLLSRRGKSFSIEIEKIIDHDEKWRSILKETETLQKKRNEVSKEVGQQKRENKDVDKKILSDMKKVSEQIKENEDKIADIRKELNGLMLVIPNLPDETIEKKDKIIKEYGDQKKHDFTVRTHWEIGEMLDILDFKKAAMLSGARFVLLIGEGAELERALISFFLDIHKEKFGYLEIMPPYLVREDIMIGTGQLPKFKEEIYVTSEDDLYLIPTAEVPLTNYHKDEILKKEDLPKKYVAYTPCFRREAGSYGKDASGLIRNHQFNKVELVNIVPSDESDKYHEQLLLESEEVLIQLRLPYRVIELGTEEIGFSASKTYDIEVWMPGEKKWREVSSCSNCRDFQARRMETKYKKDKSKEYVHTLNSSGVAVGRIFAAILENYQTKDLKIEIPEALQPYMKNKNSIGRS